MLVANFRAMIHTILITFDVNSALPSVVDEEGKSPASCSSALKKKIFPPGEVREAQAGPKMAPRGPKMGNLAQRALPDAPGTLPDPSGERFRDPFCPTNGPPEAKIVDKTMLFRWGGARLLRHASGFLLRCYAGTTSAARKIFLLSSQSINTWSRSK